MIASAEPPFRRRWLQWWTLVERSAALATQPKTDVRATDAAIESILARSTIGRAADRMRLVTRRWYVDSYTGRALMTLDREWTMLDRAVRIRSVGVGLVIGALTTLAFERLGSEPVGVSFELVPALCAFIGAIAAAFAAPLSRTLNRSGDRSGG